MYTILIIEDDRVLNLGIQECLKEFGYKVMGAQTGKAAIKIVSEACIDLAVLDVNLPDMDGFQICKKIKNIRDVPIVFLTVRDEEQDIVTGFDMGAEDYITKPFNITVLQKKIAAILKRCKTQNANQYIINKLSVDFDKKKAVQNNEIINFTPTEYKILELLILNRGHVLVKENLIQKLWDNSGNWVDEHTLAVNISRIRGKIEEPERKLLKTVFGIGYMWGDNLDEEL